MVFILKEGALQDLLRQAKDAALDVAEAARAGVELAGRQAEAVSDRAKLRRAIRDLREEIALQMKEVGELLYATHRGSPSDSSDVQEILEYVDGLYEELEGHQQQLKILERRFLCEACGAENADGNMYCHNCGRPLGLAHSKPQAP